MGKPLVKALVTFRLTRQVTEEELKVFIPKWTKEIREALVNGAHFDVKTVKVSVTRGAIKAAELQPAVGSAIGTTTFGALLTGTTA